MRRSLATHSSGNHAAAVALAARLRGIKAYVVMPDNAPKIKRVAVADYGAESILCQPTLKAREERLDKVVDKTGASFIHSYNDYRVIAGQGTADLELCEEISNLDIVMTPVGGGSLLSGTAMTVSTMLPKTHVIAAEPERADDAYRPFHAGKIIPSINPDTIADRLLTSLGSLTFPIIKHYIKDIITVTEEGIISAMRMICKRGRSCRACFTRITWYGIIYS